MADEFPAAVLTPEVAYALMAGAPAPAAKPAPVGTAAPSALSAQWSVSAWSADSPQSPGSTL